MRANLLQFFRFKRRNGTSKSLYITRINTRDHRLLQLCHVLLQLYVYHILVSNYHPLAFHSHERKQQRQILGITALYRVRPVHAGRRPQFRSLEHNRHTRQRLPRLVLHLSRNFSRLHLLLRCFSLLLPLQNDRLILYRPLQIGPCQTLRQHNTQPLVRKPQCQVLHRRHLLVLIQKSKTRRFLQNGNNLRQIRVLHLERDLLLLSIGTQERRRQKDNAYHLSTQRPQAPFTKKRSMFHFHHFF